MLLPNVDVDQGRLRRVIADQYDGAGDEIEFVPLGEDSWCYRTGSLWVSVRRDEQGHWPGAYELAHRLHRDGWIFVLAPLAGADGRVVREVDGYPVVAFPFLAVSQLAARDVTEADLEGLSVLLKQVHNAEVEADIATEWFELPFLDDLDRAWARAGDPEWMAGPLSEPLRERTSANAGYLSEIRSEVNRLGRSCRSVREQFVLTHGEPSTANVLVRHDVHRDDLMLGDWGAAMWGPPERDWFHVGRTTGRAFAGRPDFFRFYELRWALSEITEYVGRLTKPHDGNADDRAMWGRLLRYLPE